MTAQHLKIRGLARAITVFMICAVFFVVANPVKASEVIWTQPVDSDLLNLGNVLQYTYFFTQDVVGDPITAVTDDLRQIMFDLQLVDVENSGCVQNQPVFYLIWYNGTVNSSTPITLSVGLQAYDIPEEEIPANTLYGFRIETSFIDGSIGGGCKGLGIYALRGCNDNCIEPPTGSTNGDDDPYFYIEAGSLKVAVSFQNPPFINGMTTADFENWRFCVTPNSSFSYATFDIQYGSPITEFTDDHTLESPILFWGFTEKCFQYEKGNDLSSGSKSARVNVYLDGIFETGSQIFTFTVTSGTKTDLPINLSPPSNQFACNGGGILDVSYQSCRLFVFLFIPSENVTAHFSDSVAGISEKFPFAYITDVKEAVDSVSSESEEASLTLDFSSTALPLGGEEGVEIFSDDKIEELAGSENISLFRGLTEGALWIGFGFFVFFSIKGLH